MDKELLLDKLEDLVIENQSAYAVFFKGKRLQMKSGKMAWATKGHASSALISSLKSLWKFVQTRDNNIFLQKTLKELEKEGIIEFRELK